MYGNGWPGIEGQRRQDREDLRLEVLRQPRVDRRRVVGRLEEVDALGGQQRPQRLATSRPPARPSAPARAAGSSPSCCSVVSPSNEVSSMPARNFFRMRGDAHHEELVEVGAGDRQELDALEQRMRRVLRLGEHALVELEPAQLAIDVQRRWRSGRRSRAATSRWPVDPAEWPARRPPLARRRVRRPVETGGLFGRCHRV